MAKEMNDIAFIKEIKASQKRDIEDIKRASNRWWKRWVRGGLKAGTKLYYVK